MKFLTGENVSRTTLEPSILLDIHYNGGRKDEGPLREIT